MVTTHHGHKIKAIENPFTQTFNSIQLDGTKGASDEGMICIVVVNGPRVIQIALM